MPAIENPTLFARLRRTTMTELLHGRLSDGKPPAEAIAESGLDPSTQQLITLICKRTRLWKRERADVARELIAHFADARDAGVPSDKAVHAFGDPDVAAKLIRRAKIRNRSMLWHALRFLRRAAGILIVVYLGLAVYFALGKPKITVDYLAKINEPILKVPEDQRAWPFYRQIADGFDSDVSIKENKLEIYPDPRSRKWPAVVAWLKANPQMLALADQATSRRSMGFVYGNDGSIRDLKNHPEVRSNPDEPFHNALIGVLLPQLNHMRGTANMLASDALVAAQEKDADRWMHRIEQMRIVGNHSRDPGFVINYLVEIGIEAVRLRPIENMLLEHPDLLSDTQLAQLAHQNAYFHKVGDLMSFDTERYIWADVVQRIYTDDGNGNGHLSAQGIANIQVISNQASPEGLETGGYALARFAVSPVAALLTASRKDLMLKYNYFMDKMDQRLQRPWRERSGPSTDAEFTQMNQSLVERYRYVLLSILLPSLDRAGITAERILTQRDAIQIGIALELYKRKSGHYPATLSELEPTYLPSIPLDPCDGKPLRYKLVDGKPVVYSVGTDLDDDGGVVPVAKPGNVKKRGQTNGYELAIGEDDQRFDGDWVLYPEPVFPSDDEGEKTSTTQPTE